MSRESRQQLYLHYLRREGYLPELDDDGDVRFKLEGRTYFLGVDERDEAFFRLVYPGFWLIENDDEHLRALVAADFANMSSKVAKVHLVRDNTWASIEMFLASPEQFEPVFQRCLGTLRFAVEKFVEKMRENEA